MQDDVYPEDWDSFIGQPRAKRQLQVAINSAQVRKTPLGHVLLASGVPGIGKTSLANLIARDMGGQLVKASGRVTLQDARNLLADMEHGDILFLDEIHKLADGGKANAEWLLHLMQDGVLMGPFGTEEQPRITVIGATTDAGKLPQTILDRFEIVPDLVPYPDEDAGHIAFVLAGRVMRDLPVITALDAQGVARAASNSPRIMKQILVAMRDLALFDGDLHESEQYDLEATLDSLGFTEDGLNRTAQSYLTVLHREFGNTAGKTLLQERLREPGGLQIVEFLLMEKGLIGMTGRGRQLTKAGISRAKGLISCGR